MPNPFSKQDRPGKSPFSNDLGDSFIVEDRRRAGDVAVKRRPAEVKQVSHDMLEKMIADSLADVDVSDVDESDEAEYLAELEELQASGTKTTRPPQSGPTLGQRSNISATSRPPTKAPAPKNKGHAVLVKPVSGDELERMIQASLMDVDVSDIDEDEEAEYMSELQQYQGDMGGHETLPVEDPRALMSSSTPNKKVAKQPASIAFAPAVPSSPAAEPIKASPDDGRGASSLGPTPTPSSSQPLLPAVIQSTSQRQLVLDKKEDYKDKALQMKREGNLDAARFFIEQYKLCDNLVQRVDAGEKVDLSVLKDYLPKSTSSANRSEVSTKNTPSVQSAQGLVSTASSSAPVSDRDILIKALGDRRAVFASSGERAKESGDTSRAGRMGRIVKQYDTAIQCVKAGKSTDLSSLPIPPDFGPLPLPGQPVPTGKAQTAEDLLAIAAQLVKEPLDAAEDLDSITPRAPSTVTPVLPAVPQPSTGVAKLQSDLSFLLSRNAELKAAALAAKRRGDSTVALDFLRQAKGIEPMILAAQSGVRVDLSTIPAFIPPDAPPSAKAITSIQPAAMDCSEFFMVEKGDLEPTAPPTNMQEAFHTIEELLKKQIELSKKVSNHYHNLGDLASKKSFESLQKSSEQDLCMLKVLMANRKPVPKHHFVEHTFPIVKSNTELGDNDLALEIIRCINIPVSPGTQAKDVTSYVAFDFTSPSKEAQTGSTDYAKSTINPDFNQKFLLVLDRKSQAVIRGIKRMSINLRLNQYRGFLKGDKVLGTAVVKLEAFTCRSEIHDCIDFMDPEKGKKAVGGKIEVRVKIREPLLEKDVEVLREKWVVLDLESQSPSPGPSIPPYQHLERASSDTRSNPFCGFTSLDVLKYRIDQLQKQAQGNPSKAADLKETISQLQQQSLDVQKALADNSLTALKEYVATIIKEAQVFQTNAVAYSKSQNLDRAKNCLLMKKLIEKEVESIKKRMVRK